MPVNAEGTDVIRKRYERIAPFYDLLEGVVEQLLFSRWRRLLWNKIGPGHLLEVGVGTGKNFPYYPHGANVIAVDFSPKMLARAHRKRKIATTEVALALMDIEKLGFPDDTFDTVVASFVFCSVPDPVRGMSELTRILKPGGKAVFLEHVLSANRYAARIMNWFNPIVVRLVGANINRKTLQTVTAAGLTIDRVTAVSGNIVVLVEAHKAPTPRNHGEIIEQS